MRYVGGKSKLAKHLAPIILRDGPSKILEPFCGALNITAALITEDSEVEVVCSDSHADLIEMWLAISQGKFIPPTEIDSTAYYELKKSPPSPLRTFVGYGCSFSGKWWGGYASDSSGRNYCLNAANSIKKKLPILNNVIFETGEYGEQDLTGIDVVYCDPPYAGTTKPGTRGKFDHRAFWEWVNSLTIPCYVSELTAPTGQPVVWEGELGNDMTKGNRLEKLYWNGV